MLFSRKFLQLFLPALTLLLFFPQVSWAAFSDVPSSHPQYTFIEELSRQKLMEGFADNTFKPEKLISKVDFLMLVFKDIGFKPVNRTYLQLFQDVLPTNPAIGYIQKAVELGLILGPSASEYFYPGKPINRIEALRIAFPLEGIPAPYYDDIDPEELFEDIKPTSSFAYLVRAAKKQGIISVKTGTLFLPFRSLTRGDAAELLYQVQQLRQKKETGQGLTIEIVQPSPPPALTLPENEDLLKNEKFPMFLDVWNKATQDYYGKSSVNKNDLVYGAIKGMVEKLNDKYSVFQEPLKASELLNFLQGDFEGIGATLDLIDQQIVILNTIAGSPAEKVGLKAGDIVVKIGDLSTAGMTLEKALELIRGKAGTAVRLTITRSGANLEFEVTRDKITIASVSARVLSGNIGYINIDQFLLNSASEFKNAVAKILELTGNAPKGIIIDLRGNPGGYLDVAVNILGSFVGNAKVLTSTKNADGNQNFYTSTGKGELAKYPLIVLINSGSASAAEIMAGALQDYKVGKLLGEKSFGKGSVQELLKYNDGSVLKLSIAHWLTPLGRDINGLGLTPDILVEKNKEDILAGRDPQLERAISELNK